MKLVCPVCRAENEAAVACRRCKADLTPLVDLEIRREQELWMAAGAAGRGDAAAALRHARLAHFLRQGPDSQRRLAIAFLLRRSFRQALACYRSASGPEA
jgi:hypothetical protein